MMNAQRARYRRSLTIQADRVVRLGAKSAGLLALLSLCLVVACSRTDQSGASPAAAKDGKSESSEKKGEKNEKGGKEEKEAKLEKGHVKLSDAEVREAGVEAQELKPQTLADQLVLNAMVAANQDRLAHLSPRIPARVVAVLVSDGDHVKAGQVLASLDSLELGEAQAAWHHAESDQALARSEFERAESLHKDEVIADKDYLRARTEYEKAKAQTRATLERLKLLGADPSHGSDKVGSVFALTAPFAGVVVAKKAVLGELAQPDKPLFEIADLSTVWVEASLFEKDLARVRVGAPAVVTVSAYPDAEFKGSVMRIGSMLDKDTRTVPVRINVANADGRLKPEMFGSARIEGAGKAEAFVLPEAAVILLNGEPTVFIDQDGDYEARHVQVAGRRGGNVVIANGLKAGDWVVRKGAFAVKSKLLKSQIGDSD
ncbi:efflux RND transporter periplasmic adaptor subunit [Piscinibacter terrae]|uniref:Efflux RND transporter periplasmic adaptor subunit n=1 Tax=Piscinibacter terrae TaxID=2496871 RepID=A0A3N7HIJ5_9BURK|nr:efflux RND transporter periplasmic adaptor subunit [Albitalea terrae]RQP21854.1 efflux RND transporter periplasmic adaptor subunit [Albitalea terrae]